MRLGTLIFLALGALLGCSDDASNEPAGQAGRTSGSSGQSGQTGAGSGGQVDAGQGGAGGSGQSGAGQPGAGNGGAGQGGGYKGAAWKPASGPVLEGQFAPQAPFSGDASVVKSGATFFIYHTCYAVDRQGTDTCLATSQDGATWTLVDTGDAQSQGRVLRSEIGAWDEAHETPFAIQWKGETWLYAIGYSPASTGFFGAKKVQLAVARSKDGVHFEPTQGPLFELSTLDSHGLTSPTIVEHEGKLVMLYTGWCLDAASCPRVKDGKLVALLGATSSDGVAWQKRAEPVVLDVPMPWASQGIAETHLLREPTTGKFLLFFQGLSSGAHVLGMGWADDPFGPWTWLPDPILKPDDVGGWASGGLVAPHVFVESGKSYLWFSGEETDPTTGKIKTFRIGLATADGPLLIAP
ncbi:MAG: hypothetical protein MUF64_06210 [Polyangiaceae bacterium]|jgi:hypothetical protein|nr:hypothetical protein [Polyangiaceae bacterium]